VPQLLPADIIVVELLTKKSIFHVLWRIARITMSLRYAVL
jgi:hypothetical protein